MGMPNGFSGLVVMSTLRYDPASGMPDFSKGHNGLLPTIAQDAETDEVLMLAWMNAESFALTLEQGNAIYYSRSRKSLWRKGERSGNIQRVEGIFIDCDADTILLRVEQLGGAACHTGFRSCFHRELSDRGWQTVGKPLFDPAEVYGKEL